MKTLATALLEKGIVTPEDVARGEAETKNYQPEPLHPKNNFMTIAELIELLKGMPPQAPVFFLESDDIGALYPVFITEVILDEGKVQLR